MNNLIPDSSLDSKKYLQSDALDLFLPGRITQESFVKTYQPKIITVGIGGNDVGFADKLQACLGPDTCSWAATIDGREKTAVEMKGLFNKLVSTYQTLKDDSPDAKIYAIGYPRFIEVDGTCSSLRELLLDRTEREFIDEGVVYLNQIIEAAAKKVGIKYISIADSYGNHKICGGGGEDAANFIKPGDDIALPVDWLKWLKLVGQESFHPNALGHQLASAAILNTVNGDLENYDYCDGITSCPQNVSVPEPSSYWLSAYHDLPTQIAADSVDNLMITGQRTGSYIVRIRNYMLMPLSAIDIEVNSTPRSLGYFTAQADGSLNTVVNLPEDLEEGFHTIHIYGKSYSGENIDLYKVIRYFKSDPIVNGQPTAQVPVINSDKKSSTGNNTDVSNGIVSLDPSDQLRDDYGVWSSGLFMNNTTTYVQSQDRSILATSSGKKVDHVMTDSQNNALLNNVIIATLAAVAASVLTFLYFRFSRAE